VQHKEPICKMLKSFMQQVCCSKHKNKTKSCFDQKDSDNSGAQLGANPRE